MKFDGSLLDPLKLSSLKYDMMCVVWRQKFIVSLKTIVSSIVAARESCVCVYVRLSSDMVPVFFVVPHGLVISFHGGTC